MTDGENNPHLGRRNRKKNEKKERERERERERRVKNGTSKEIQAALNYNVFVCQKGLFRNSFVLEIASKVAFSNIGNKCLKMNLILI